MVSPSRNRTLCRCVRSDCDLHFRAVQERQRVMESARVVLFGRAFPFVLTKHNNVDRTRRLTDLRRDCAPQACPMGLYTLLCDCGRKVAPGELGILGEPVLQVCRRPLDRA